MSIDARRRAARPDEGEAGWRAHAPFFLLVAGAFALLTASRQAQRGMFVDGVTYASISRNLAQGVGTLWSPSYTATLYPRFLDHPPLGFALQAAAFAVLGDSLLVERVYSLLLGLVTVVLIGMIWRRTTGVHTPGARAFWWLPVVFWLIPPSTSWSVVNNLLEVPQTVFVLLSITAFVVSMDSPNGFGIAALGGLAVVGAVLAKGPTGLFPLAAPVVALALLPARRSQAVRSGAAMMIAAGVAAAAIWAWPAARAALSGYWTQQVAASISGTRGTDRWRSLARYLGDEILLRMAGLAVLALLARRFSSAEGGAEAGRTNLEWSPFFFVLGLAGSLPVAASAHISGHYFVPSTACFALAFAGWSFGSVAPLARSWLRRATVRRAIAAFGLFLFVAAAAIPMAGRSIEPRDIQLVAEFSALAPDVPRGATIGACEASRADWALHAYMMRLFSVSLDAGAGRARSYFLENTAAVCADRPACPAVAAVGRFILRDCRSAAP